MDTVKNNELVEKLFKVGAHFGFMKARRHPTAKPFIFGAKNRVEIFDLEKTGEALTKATDFVTELAKNGGMLLLVGGKSESKNAIVKGAISIDMPYVAGRWIGGTLTNFNQIRKRVETMEDLMSQKEKGELGKYTKKERLLIDRDIERLDRFFGGLVNLKQLPKALFVIDPRREAIAVAEAKVIGIPVVALAGSDCDLTKVDYAIPANDSAIKSIDFFVGAIAEAYQKGKDAPADVKKVTK